MIHYFKNARMVGSFLAVTSIGAILLTGFLMRPPSITTAEGGLAGSTPTPVTLGQLRQVAESRGLRVGVTDGGFGSDLYNNTISQEFNSITPENYMKFEMIHPCPPVWLINSNPSVANWVAVHKTEREHEKYDCTLSNAANDEWEWADVDAIVQWAAARGIGFRGHTLVWWQQNPGWLTDEAVTLSAAEREQIMREHIQQVIGRYCAYENVYVYDVVNEALTENGLLLEGPWAPIPDYIDKAFRTARATLDNCGQAEVKLYYSDWVFEYGNQKTNVIYNYLSQLLQGTDPTPIDGIGFKTHKQQLDGSTPEQDASGLITTMNRFSGGLGLEVAITETDLAIQATPPANWYEEQAEWYAGRLQACLLALNCTAFTTWGMQDGSSFDDEPSDPVLAKPNLVDNRSRRTWYVTTTGSDENDCATVDSPCATIMGALNRPGFVDGDRVLVAEGVYRIGYDGDFDGITISQSVFLSGGWDNSFAKMAGETIIENVFRGFTIKPGISVSIFMLGIGSGSGVGIYNEGTLSVNQVTVYAGSSSGLFNKGSMTIKNSKLSHSAGCGILNGGVIKFSDSQVIGNYGCGITSGGTMTIERSTIQGSVMRFGCTGISNSGTMRISDSAILDNGLIYPNFGAGLCNWGEATLVNSTISGNEAERDPGGGIYNDGPKLALYNTSVVYNHAGAGGGIYVQSGSVTLQNSLVAQNTAKDGSRDCWGSLSSLGYNLLGDSQGCTFTGIVGDLLEIIAQVFPATPLYHYPQIGETPPTAPLAHDSPAVDAGDPGGCKDENGRLMDADQRGVERVGRCDIGAYEYDPAYDPLHYLWLGLVHGSLP